MEWRFNENIITSAGSDHSRLGAALWGVGEAALAIEAEDRAILRRLAAEVAELAARPIEAEKRELWRAQRPGTHPAGHLLRPGERLDRDHPAAHAAVPALAGPPVGDDPAQGDLLGRARWATTT